MCLALIAYAAHPVYRLVVAANRDEFHARPAAPAAWWPEGFLAGRDLQAGGTWLAVDRRGRFALLTNVRDPSRHDPGAPSRGALVPHLLAASAPPSASLPALIVDANRCNGFNLIAGSTTEPVCSPRTALRAASPKARSPSLSNAGGPAALMWGSNRAARTRVLGPGIYGVSNHLLDTPWPKLTRTKAAFRRWCDATGAGADLAPLFALLGDTERAPDEMLPATGVSLERERMLSSPFIVSADYGTRCSTILTIDHRGAARLVERSFDPDGRATGEVEFRFAVADPTP